MKQCISRLVQRINHLWRTLKEYVCKRFILSRTDSKCQVILDLNSDGKPEVEIQISSDQDIGKEDSHVKSEDQEITAQR